MHYFLWTHACKSTKTKSWIFQRRNWGRHVAINCFLLPRRHNLFLFFSVKSLCVKKSTSLSLCKHCISVDFNLCALYRPAAAGLRLAFKFWLLHRRFEPCPVFLCILFTSVCVVDTTALTGCTDRLSEDETLSYTPATENWHDLCQLFYQFTLNIWKILCLLRPQMMI